MVRFSLAAAVVLSVVLWRALGTESPERRAPATAAVAEPPAPAPRPAARPSSASSLPTARPAEPRVNADPVVVDVAAEGGELPLVGNAQPSPNWPGWRCADVDDGTRRSLWLLEDSPPGSGSVHEGTCAEWANRAPEESLYDPDPFDESGV